MEVQICHQDGRGLLRGVLIRCTELHFAIDRVRLDHDDRLIQRAHLKRTGVARDPLRKDEMLLDKLAAQLTEIRRLPDLVRSFFRAPSAAYVAD